jgi:hypothetical protein
VPTCRCWNWLYQVNVKVAEPLSWVDNVLPALLSLWPAATVGSPCNGLRCQARPYNTTGDEPPCSPDARVCKAVNGIEDWPVKEVGTSGRKTPKEEFTRMGVPCIMTSERRVQRRCWHAGSPDRMTAPPPGLPNPLEATEEPARRGREELRTRRVPLPQVTSFPLCQGSCKWR